MSVTYETVIDELENRHPWLYKQGVEDIDILDSRRASVTLGDGRTYIYDETRNGNKLRLLRKTKEFDIIDEGDWRCAFSYTLEQKLKQSGMTKQELAKMIGVAPSIMGKYLSGILTPSAWTMIKLAIALDCDISDLQYPKTYT